MLSSLMTLALIVSAIPRRASVRCIPSMSTSKGLGEPSAFLSMRAAAASSLLIPAASHGNTPTVTGGNTTPASIASVYRFAVAGSVKPLCAGPRPLRIENLRGDTLGRIVRSLIASV